MRGSEALICTLAAAALAGCGGGGGGGLDTDKVKAALTQIDRECSDRSEALDKIEDDRDGAPTNANLKKPLTPEFKESVSYVVDQLDDHADDEVDSGSGRNLAYKDFVKVVGVRLANPSLQVRSCGGGEARPLGRRMIRAANAKGAT